MSGVIVPDPGKRVFVFRPEACNRRTVFENQLLLYDYLQKHHGYKFQVAVDAKYYEPDSRFDWVQIKSAEWQSLRGRHFFFRKGDKVRRLVEMARGADAILTIDPVVYPKALLAFPAAKELNIPVWFDATITLRSEHLSSAWHSWKYRLLQKIVAQADRILIPTPGVIERFEKLRLLDAANIAKFRLLGHPVDTEHFLCSDAGETNSSDLICVSRLIPSKGIATILEAFACVANEFTKARLVFLGDGLLNEYIKNRVADESWKTRVVIKPTIAHEHLPKFYANACAHVSHPLATPVWEEYFGVANLEAMACGLPIIVSRSGGVPFALRPPSRPFWVAERDVEGLVESMKTVLTLTAEERRELGKANRQYVVQTYSLPAVAARFLVGVGGSGHTGELRTYE